MTLLALLVVVAAGLPDAAVVEPVANMYSAPTTEADVVSQAICGASVQLLEQKDGWGHVRTADDYRGWLPLSAVRKERSYARRGRVAEVQSLAAHIYREADVEKHAPLITVPFETRLEVIAEPSEQRRWLQVRLPDDRTGWVQRGDVAFDVKPLSIAETAAFSRQFLGLPYTWGGTSSYGYDCSGFVQMLCRRRGVTIPRDARLQVKWSGVKPVERKDIAAGDLLYFGGSKKITHTGYYLGEGKFINATTHRKPMVRIDDLNEPYWTELLVAIRRLK
jgi:hypothetical protein